MKKGILLFILFLSYAAQSQPIIQPLGSGNYWEIDDYRQRLPAVANDNTFPSTISFPNGFVRLNSVKVNRIAGANEIHWTLGGMQNISDFYVEYSRDLRSFEPAGIVKLLRKEGDDHYVFRHWFNDNSRVYYRLALVRDGKVLAYTPAVQVLEEENTTKVFPTLVKGGTFYIQTGQPYEKLQVLNGASQTVFEKGLGNQTGTITVVLPALSRGIYFVRLLSDQRPQHMQRIMVE